MGRIAVALSAVRKLFPNFVPQWEANHPECIHPEDVVLGHPEFGAVRHVVVCEADDIGKAEKPLWDQFRIEEGPAGSDYPGTIIVPFSHHHKWVYLGLMKKPRAIRGIISWEFPQGFAKAGETSIETAKREFAEEVGADFANRAVYTQLPGTCPEPDWFCRDTQIIAAELPVENLPDSLFWRLTAELSTFANLLSSATSGMALLRFLTWKCARGELKLEFASL